MISRIKKISPKTNCPFSPGGTSPSPVRKRGQERCICTYNRGKLPRPRCEKEGTPGETYPAPVSKTVYFTYTRGNFPAPGLKNGAKTVYCTYPRYKVLHLQRWKYSTDIGVMSHIEEKISGHLNQNKQSHLFNQNIVCYTSDAEMNIKKIWF